ncbi:MAG: tetratricopeptide repeat protein [Cyanosarcina radialis HA8281-LM2]|nr:tetratricopeptide repeat protein [Cyanosarcina radialis HA8281-LM2]
MAMVLQRYGMGLLKAIASICLMIFSSSGAFAADEQPKPSPLEITKPDPLLPRQPTKKQPLSPQERQQLQPALDELNSQATTQYQAGNKLAAFEIWYRELRLRRFLGVLEEVKALGRVGAIAWQDNQKEGVQAITKRLKEIQQEAQKKPPVDLTLLEAMGQAYQQVRLPGPALEVYQQLLADARAKQDKAREIQILKLVAELQLSYFDYPKAAATYEELLNYALAQGDYLNQVVYVQKLADIYDRAKQPKNALLAKQRLLESYVKSNQVDKIPALKIQIAADYELLGQPNEASRTYQEAYQQAWDLKQYANVSQALQKLANLYYTRGDRQSALQIYRVLLQVEPRSYSFYDLMNTYDRIGQIYLELKDYPQALAAFQKGLEIATALKYQEGYFAAQIDRVQKESGNR